MTPVTPVKLSDGVHHFEELVRCEHFVVRRHTAVDRFQLKTDMRFRILMVLEGTVRAVTDSDSDELTKGCTTLVAAGSEGVTIIPHQRATVLEILRP